jgi:hypothetical protein
VDARGDPRAPGIPEFAKLRRFVDRGEQRRRTWWAIDPEDLPGQHAARGALITGPRESGKTWLALASLLIFHLRGRRLHYIDLTAEPAQAELGESTKDWLGTLRAIRDGTRGCYLSPELDPRAFSAVNAELNWLVSNQPGPLSASGPGPVRDERQAFAPDAGQAGRRIAAIFEAFRTALARAAGRQHIVLALDGIEGVMEQSWRDYLLPALIAPLARGDVPGVSLLLIVPQDLLTSRVPAAEADLLERVDVWDFENTQLDRVIREYGVYSQLSPAETGRIKAFIGEAHGRVPARIFGQLEQMLRLIAGGGW